MKRVFLIANSSYDFGEHQINSPACPTIASGHYVWHSVSVSSLRVDGSGLNAQIIKGSDSDVLQGWNYRNGIIYKIAGFVPPKDYSGNCYIRTRISIKVTYPVNNYCGNYPEDPGHPDIWPYSLWYSPRYPTNTWFWYCVVSQTPQVEAGQSFNAQVGFPFEQRVSLSSPMVRIPERVSATGLPPGVTLRYATDQPIIGREGFAFGTIHYPADIEPVLVGTPTLAGVYTVTITATNPIGSTSTTVTLNISTPPLNFVALGSQGAASLYTGDTPVDALYLGSSKVYP